MSRQVVTLLTSCLVLSLAIAVAVAVSGDSGSSSQAGRIAEAQGVLTRADARGLVLRPFRGGDEQSYVVQRQDVPRLDLTHLQIHVEYGNPVRVRYTEDDGERVAREVLDLTAFG